MNYQAVKPRPFLTSRLPKRPSSLYDNYCKDCGWRLVLSLDDLDEWECLNPKCSNYCKGI